MKLKEEILIRIKGSSLLRKELRAALGVSNPTFCRYVNENSDDLTKAASLKVIREYFNLTDEQILVEDKTAA